MLKKKFMNIFGISATLGLFFGIAIFALSLFIDIKYVGFRMKGEWPIILGIIFLTFWGIVTTWTMVSLPISMRGEKLVTVGIYTYVRHPLYSAAIFLFYPGIAFILRSWVILASTILVYLNFKWIIIFEERYLIQKFGKAYREYMKRVNGFFPKLSK